MTYVPYRTYRTVRRVSTLLWRTVPYVPYRAVHAVPYHAERTAKPRAAHMISISSTSHHRLLTAGYIFNVISPPKKFSGSSLRLMFFDFSIFLIFVFIGFYTFS